MSPVVALLLGITLPLLVGYIVGFLEGRQTTSKEVKALLKKHYEGKRALK